MNAPEELRNDLLSVNLLPTGVQNDLGLCVRIRMELCRATTAPAGLDNDPTPLGLITRPPAVPASTSGCKSLQPLTLCPPLMQGQTESALQLGNIGLLEVRSSRATCSAIKSYSLTYRRWNKKKVQVPRRVFKSAGFQQLRSNFLGYNNTD